MIIITFLQSARDSNNPLKNSIHVALASRFLRFKPSLWKGWLMPGQWHSLVCELRDVSPLSLWVSCLQILTAPDTNKPKPTKGKPSLVSRERKYKIKTSLKKDLMLQVCWKQNDAISALCIRTTRIFFHHKWIKEEVKKHCKNWGPIKVSQRCPYRPEFPTTRTSLYRSRRTSSSRQTILPLRRNYEQPWKKKFVKYVK